MTSLSWLSAWLLASIAADTVSVAVQPLDDRASFAIIEACNRALDETRCVVEGSPDAPSTVPSTTEPALSPTAETPAAITRVRVALSSAELERAAIAFESGGVLSEPRILEFDSADPVEERFRAIGLVIAARLLEESAARKGQPAIPERIVHLPPRLRRFGLETALFIGQGLDEGNMRWGLRSRALLRPLASVPVSALFAVRLGTASASSNGLDDQPQMRWIDLGLGVQGAVPLIKDTFALELHAEGAYQRVTASLEDRATGRTEDGSRHRIGAFVGAQLAWTPWPFWGLFIGAESSLFWPPLVLEVRRSEVAKEDPLKLAAHLGQRLSF